jgi:hypothetical protein
MSKLKRSTINLLRKVEAQILEEPKRLDMGDFGSAFGGSFGKDKSIPECRTRACIGGWAILLKKPRVWKDFIKVSNAASYSADIGEVISGDVHDEARGVLGLDRTQSCKLFYHNGSGDGGWPELFETAYDNAKSAKQRAKVTVQRIEHFIATDGAE